MMTAEAQERWRRAPYWVHVEDEHLDALVAGGLDEGLAPPLLVVGSGRGLVVEHLRGRGLAAWGVDAGALAGGLDLVRAAPTSLPYPDQRFATVVLSTGVLDTLDDQGRVNDVLGEAFRVLRSGGTLMALFYQLPRAVEEELRHLGVILGTTYHARRLFDLQAGPLRPLGGAREVSRWSGRGLLPAMIGYLRFRLAHPPELDAERVSAADAVRRASSAGIELAELRRELPEVLPYRREREVRELFERAGFPCGSVEHHADSLVVKCQRLTRRRARVRTYGRTSPRSSAEWVVRTTDVSKQYPGSAKKAVDGLSVLVERGTIFGILGPNGAGKTTTLSMLSGLLRPDSGEIEFLRGLRGRELKRHIGYVPQDLALYPRLTAWENMAFFGGLYGVTGDRLARRADELLDMVGLGERRDSMVDTYSTGMQRRLNLAIGLIHEPDLILLDEPTVGIDPQSRNCIFEAVSELRRAGVTILYTTHYMEEASRLCDRIVIMDEGKIILEGNPREAVLEHGRVRIEFHAHVGARDGERDDEARRGLEAALVDLDSVVECSLGERVLSVAIESGEDAMAVARRITALGEELGVALSLSSVVEPSLETLFLEITGRSLRDLAS
jgi:ABC-2 type transport system ATP-binding protein